jgi:hypothetical protein
MFPKSAKGAAARRQTVEEELRRSLGRALDTGSVLREFRRSEAFQSLDR